MWFRTPRKARSVSARSASSRLGKWLRPRLEVLDDRVVPALASRFTEFAIPASFGDFTPRGMVVGADNNLWFTGSGVAAIGRYDPDTGEFSRFDTTGGQFTGAITATRGPNGTGLIWYTQTPDAPPDVGNNPSIGVMDLQGQVQANLTFPAGSSVSTLAASPDNESVWFSQYFAFNPNPSPTTNGGVGKVLVADLPVPVANHPFTSAAATYYHAYTMFGVANIAFDTNRNSDPYGNLWYAGSVAQSHIGRMTQAGETTFLGFDPFGVVRGLAFDQDGNAWTCSPGTNRIVKVTHSTAQNTYYPLPTFGGAPYSIVAQPDANGQPSGTFWFAAPGTNRIGRINSGGPIVEYTTPTSQSGVQTVIIGPYGNLWFVEPTAKKIGRLLLPATPPVPTFEFHDALGNAVTAPTEGQTYYLRPTNGYREDRFRWTIANSTGGSFTVNDAEPSIQFSESGSWTVTLTITDVSGNVGTTTRTMVIDNVAPTGQLSLSGGIIDHNFGTGGVKTLTTDDRVFAPSQLADGRIIAPFTINGAFVGFRRFEPNGNPDPTFGGNNDGRLVVASNDPFVAYCLQDNNIILATRSASGLLLTRFDESGQVDPTLHDIVIVGSTSITGAVVVTTLSDDKILLAGGTSTGMALERFTANGVPDILFGPNGVARVDTPAPTSFVAGVGQVVYNTPAALVVQPDGKILVGDYSFAVHRFNCNGTKDTTFGEPLNQTERSGCAKQVYFWDINIIGSDPLSSLVLGSDGRILAVGNYGMVRYTSEGDLDPSFGPVYDGVIAFPNATTNYFASEDAHRLDFKLGFGTPQSLFPAGAMIQADGTILIGGPSGSVTSLRADGTLDGTYGIISSQFNSSQLDGRALGMTFSSRYRTTLIGNVNDGIGFVRYITAPNPDLVLGGGQTFTLALAANDVSSVDQGTGFTYEIDWDGVGGWDETVCPSMYNGIGLVRNHAFPHLNEPTDYTIRVRVTDKDGGSTISTLDVTVLPVPSQTIAALLEDELPTDPISGLPAISLNVTHQAEAYSILAAVPPQTVPVAVVLNGTGVDFTSFNPSIPSNVKLVINGGVFNPGSPSLTLTAGDLVIVNATFVNATNAPTILVTGGRLTIRDSVIQESTGYDRVAIEVAGGFVDLGTAADPGRNNINRNGPGQFFHNLTGVPISTIGVALTVNGAPLAQVAPSSVQGLVWVDANNNGEVDFGEEAVAGVAITLTGTDDLGNAVYRAVQTDAHGVYVVADLRPSGTSGYTITEAQPAGLLDGRDTRGTVNGVLTGSAATNDAFSGVVVSQGGSVAENYNFGERPGTAGGTHQTAAIGFWQNKKGQDLIKALNGGAMATSLGDWLATTFPNLYGSLAGRTNAEVAAFYKTLFARNGQTSPGGPPKMDAQVMATALAVYVTNLSLAGTTAVAYGFQVTATGVGTRTVNVGSRGMAFGVGNGSFVSIMDLLLAVNARSRNGLLYDSNGDGVISGSEANLRTMANDVFSAINEAGGL